MLTTDLRARLRLRDAATEAGATLVRRPLRTLLTALGTILGVGAFVATTGIAQTARAQLSSRFDALKATEVRVEDAAPDGTNPFPPDVDSRLQALAGVNYGGQVVPVGGASVTEVRAHAARHDGAHTEIPVLGASPGALRAVRPSVAAGRLFDDFHQRRSERVAVLGRYAAEELGIFGVENSPAVFVLDEAFLVIGVLDEVKRDPDLLLSVIVPETTASITLPVSNGDRAVVIDTAPGAAQLIGSQAPLALRPHDALRLHAMVPPDPATLRTQVESDVQGFFYALAGLSLLIGAIAIANATLLDIIERRAEIGIRRALGATRAHVSGQVTLEAALVGAIAGIIGATCGVAATSGVALAKGWTPTIDPGVLLVAPFIGTVTGTLAGAIPAWRASRTPPATAVRQ